MKLHETAWMVDDFKEFDMLFFFKTDYSRIFIEVSFPAFCYYIRNHKIIEHASLGFFPISQ